MSDTLEHAPVDLAEPVNRYIQVPIAKQIVGFLKNTPVTPNHVTYFLCWWGLLPVTHSVFPRLYF